MSRRALLLAIADYEPLPPLDYVARDIPRLRRALASAGFDPQAIDAAGAGVEFARNVILTSTRLRMSVRAFFQSARADDDLLLFLSGHGIEFEGRRVILPPDYDVREPQSPDDLVWDGWIVEQARGSLARSAIVLIDACRDGARIELAANKSAGASSTVNDRPLEGHFTAGTDAPTIVFLYSCAAREQSGIDLQGRLCSAFTRAVSEAFEMETGPSELMALAEVTRNRLRSYSDGKQTLTASGQDGRAGAWAALVAHVIDSQ
jgi:Caspase domain